MSKLKSGRHRLKIKAAADQLSHFVQTCMSEQPNYPGPYGSDNVDLSNFNT